MRTKLLIGNENSARSFLTEVFLNPLGSWTSAPSGHGRPHQNACFSRISRVWPKFLPPDVRRDIRVDVRRISGPKTYSLGWFPFLIFGLPSLQKCVCEFLVSFRKFFGCVRVSFVALWVFLWAVLVSDWELVDPAVADPAAEDNDKRTICK